MVYNWILEMIAFQSTPRFITAANPAYVAKMRHGVRFQSMPRFITAANVCSLRLIAASDVFQSTPRFITAANPTTVSAGVELQVSIHAAIHHRGEHRSRDHWNFRKCVSIHAAIHHRGEHAHVYVY